MNQCLNCKKEYEAKRAHSKYCSDSCRVMYNRKHPANSVSKIQVQAMYNEIMDAIALITQSKSLPPPVVGIVESSVEWPESAAKTPKHYVDAINGAESLKELGAVVQEIEASKSLIWAEKRDLKRLAEERSKILYND